MDPYAVQLAPAVVEVSAPVSLGGAFAWPYATTGNVPMHPPTRAALCPKTTPQQCGVDEGLTGVPHRSGQDSERARPAHLCRERSEGDDRVLAVPRHADERALLLLASIMLQWKHVLPVVNVL